MMYLWPLYFDDKTTDGEEYASAPDIVPWQTKMCNKNAINKITAIETGADIVDFFFYFFNSYSDFFYVKDFNAFLIASIQTSKSQLIPIAAEMHAAGAKTSKSLIMTEAK